MNDTVKLFDCIKKYLIMCYMVAIELYEKEVELYYTEKGQKF